MDGDGDAAAPRVGRRAAPLFVAADVATVVVTAVPSRALPAPTGARSGGDQPATPVRVAYHLAVGASEPVGYQPQAGPRHGAPTTQGFANDLLARERSRWPGLRLVQVVRPGGTAAAVPGGGRCA